MNQTYLSRYHPPLCAKSSYLVSFEGIDGSGKSTQIQLFCRQLNLKGFKTFVFREPGATAIGESLRNAILNSTTPLQHLTESFIFMASRVENIVQNILPKLEEERTIVIMDRFLDSTFAYQAFGGSLDLDLLLNLHSTSPLNLCPHITFCLDPSLETAQARQSSRGEKEDYFESQKTQFMQRVQKGYYELAKLFPQRICMIDANHSAQQVFESLYPLWEAFLCNR